MSDPVEPLHALEPDFTLSREVVRRRSSVTAGDLSSQRLYEEVERATKKHKEVTHGHVHKFRKICRRWFDSKFMYWWRHPMLRLLAPMYILWTDLIIHAADPPDHSEMEYGMTGAGEAWNLVNLFNGQPLTPVEQTMKLSLAIAAIVLGCELPRRLRRWWIAYLLKKGHKKNSTIFRDNRGAFLLPLLGICTCLTLAAWTWNFVLEKIVGEPKLRGVNYEQSKTKYMTTGFGCSNRVSANIIDSGVFILDFAAVASVIDLMLQDGALYPDLGKVPDKRYVPRPLRGADLRKAWTEKWGGWLRIIVTWSAFLISTTCAMFWIWHESRVRMILRSGEPASTWAAKWNQELTRAIVYSTQFFADSVIVQQDWEFPTFENEMQIAMLGTNIAFEGRFFNYFMMIAVAMVDFKCLYQTIWSYDPLINAQYVDRSKILWSILDPEVLNDLDIAKPRPITFTDRNNSRCFRRLTWEKIRQLPCFHWMQWEGKNSDSVYEPTGQIYVQGGFNACCDQRIEATYDGTIFTSQGSSYASWVRIFLCFFPPVASLILAKVLGHFIASSRREMCRRVVLTKMISYRINLEKDSVALEWKDVVALRNQVFSEYNQENFVPVLSDLVTTSIAASIAGGRASEEESDEPSDDEKRDYEGLYPVILKRPPISRSPLLLVCHTGVYSIQAGVYARMKDLLQEIQEKEITLPIKPENMRVRIKPRGHLDEDQWLGALLPPKEEGNVCLFVHACIAREPSIEEAEHALDWPRLVFFGAMHGCRAFIGRVCRAIAVITGCFASKAQRLQELTVCCSEACEDCMKGGDYQQRRIAEATNQEVSRHMSIAHTLSRHPDQMFMVGSKTMVLGGNMHLESDGDVELSDVAHSLKSGRGKVALPARGAAKSETDPSEHVMVGESLVGHEPSDSPMQRSRTVQAD